MAQPIFPPPPHYSMCFVGKIKKTESDTTTPAPARTASSDTSQNASDESTASQGDEGSSAQSGVTAVDVEDTSNETDLPAGPTGQAQSQHIDGMLTVSQS